MAHRFRTGRRPTCLSNELQLIASWHLHAA